MKARASNSYVNHNISHIRQRFNWDCGIACVLMLLSEQQRKEFIEGFSRICLEEGFGHATWTIDLCYLLKRFGIKHRMYTTRQAANNRARSDEVANRVRNRFRNASHNGITVVDGVLSTEQVITHVVSTGPAIVLVDAALLSCDLCKHNKLTSEFRRIFGGSYRGHYILVVDWAGGRLRYHNPARAHPLCATTRKNLRVARTPPHTDCDVILV
ncbi:protein GUCD1 isoform X2 [Maniola jurtina]|uniref:protein GUCD1 isoform X2 n=1 Tax=Maniola jurtina TaxID=191418 RepID=UPI001E68CD0A|nr:protein GUCD1 isoform X2 [Maniola jurtina]